MSGIIDNAYITHSAINNNNTKNNKEEDNNKRKKGKQLLINKIKQVQDDAKLLLRRQNKQASLKLGPQQLQKLLVDKWEPCNTSTIGFQQMLDLMNLIF